MEISIVADQAVAAVNLGKQGPSSIPEAVVHPDLTIVVQQHIVGDFKWAQAEKMVRSQGKQESQNSWYWMVVHVQALLYCVNSLYKLKTLTAQCY